MPIGIVISRSSVPRRALAQHRDRGDEEHRDEREDPEQRRRRRGRTSRAAVEDVAQAGSAARAARRAAARACAGRGAAGRRTRAAVASVSAGAHAAVLDEREERRFEVVGAGPLAAARPACRSATMPPSRMQQQPVAARGLVHDVAGDEQRRAVVGEPAESRPEVAPQHRVEADGRLVEHEQVGPAEQRGRERDACALAAGERARRRCRRGSPRPTVSIALATAACGAPRTPREVAEVLAHGQVAVDGGAWVT